MNNYLIISEICNNLNHILHEDIEYGYITKKDFIDFTSEDEKKFEILVKKELKNILDIYQKRYEKEYGKLTNTYISFFYDKPHFIDITISGQQKRLFTFYIIRTSIEYNLKHKKFIPSGFYTFYKTDSSGKNAIKIAEGSEREEFTHKSKYGELLNIKKGSLKNIKKFKLKK